MQKSIAMFQKMARPTFEATPLEWLDRMAQDGARSRWSGPRRLFIADGCAEDKQCATFYLEWKDNSFKDLRMVPQRGPSRPDDSSEQ